MTFTEIANLASIALQTTALMLSIRLGWKYKMKAYTFFVSAYAMMILRRIAVLLLTHNPEGMPWLQWLDAGILPMLISASLVTGMVLLSVERAGVVTWTPKQ